MRYRRTSAAPGVSLRNSRKPVNGLAHNVHTRVPPSPQGSRAGTAPSEWSRPSEPSTPARHVLAVIGSGWRGRIRSGTGAEPVAVAGARIAAEIAGLAGRSGPPHEKGRLLHLAVGEGRCGHGGQGEEEGGETSHGFAHGGVARSEMDRSVTLGRVVERSAPELGFQERRLRPATGQTECARDRDRTAGAAQTRSPRPRRPRRSAATPISWRRQTLQSKNTRGETP